MSMLAERRSKQKWSLNPRGKQWSDDSNKFGQKMLEKMGWTSGKGLGANEQGQTEHIRVRTKNNRIGIGYEDKDNQWTQHQDDYGKLLLQLQGDSNLEATVKEENADTELSGKSLELKSKHSRARVHYHKFTRGKDVNKYSTKDLANIFGKKDLNESNSEKEQNRSSKESPLDPVGSTENTGGFLTVNGGNITDYFKKKLPHFMKRDHDGVKETNSDSETEQRHDFRLVGFKSEDIVPQFDQESVKKQKKDSSNAFDNLGFDLNQPDSRNTRTAKKRKKEFVYENEGLDLEYPEESSTPKRMKSNMIIQSSNSTMESVNEVACLNGGFVNTALNLNDSADESHNGIEFEVSRTQFGVDNDALDLTDEIKKKKRVTFNDMVEYDVDNVKKKKSKAKLDKFEVENGKLKKKQKNNILEVNADMSANVIGFVNEALDVDVICEEINDNELNERKSKKVKRKKNKKISNLETIEEITEENKEKGCEIIAEIEVITLNESVSDLENNLSRNCRNVDGNSNEEELEPKISKKRKKRDRKEKLGKEIGKADIIEIVESEEPEPVKKKSKRNKECKIEIYASDETSKRKKNRKEQKDVIRADEVVYEEKDNSFDKENTNSIQDNGIDSQKKKGKTRKKSKGESANDASGSNVSNNEVTFKDDNLNVNKEEMGKTVCISEHVETSLTKSKIETRIDAKNHKSDCQRFSNTKMSKKTIRTLFSKAPILHFSGSNINDITGYGVDIK